MSVDAYVYGNNSATLNVMVLEVSTYLILYACI